MASVNYNHLYYFWVVYKEGSIIKASERLHLAPQTITGQIKVLEGRLQGKLFKRKGRGIEPSDLGHLVFRYAENMFNLSQEMLTVLALRENKQHCFNVGIVDSLSKHFVGKILNTAIEDNELIRIRCFESPYDILLEQLFNQELDVIISDSPANNDTYKEFLSKKIGESDISFWSLHKFSKDDFPFNLENAHLLIPGYRSTVGRKLQDWFDSYELNVHIKGEFDDSALMKEFSSNDKVIFVASSNSLEKELLGKSVFEIGKINEFKEEYYVVYPNRIIQHQLVEKIININYSDFFQ